MKKRICLGLLLLLIPLAGCSGGASQGSAAEAPPTRAAESTLPASAQTAEPEDAALSATRLEEAPRPLTKEEILTAYYLAEEAWGWFDLSPLPDNGETVQVDGIVYRRVDVLGMEDLEDLRTYLRSLFSSELTDRLLSAGGSHPLYRDIDGRLHVSFKGRSRAEDKGTVQVEVDQLDGQTYSLEVSVDLLDSERSAVIGLECWSFPFAFVDGRWVFTDFRLVY